MREISSFKKAKYQSPFKYLLRVHVHLHKPPFHRLPPKPLAASWHLPDDDVTTLHLDSHSHLRFIFLFYTARLAAQVLVSGQAPHLLDSVKQNNGHPWVSEDVQVLLL